MTTPETPSPALASSLEQLARETADAFLAFWESYQHHTKTQRVIVFHIWEAGWNTALRQATQHPAVTAEIQEYLQWVLETFPGETVEEQINHLKEEFDELMSELNQPGEYADVFMLLICVANRHGIDVLQAFREKFAVNKDRKWTKTENGFRHVKAPDHDAAAQAGTAHPVNYDAPTPETDAFMTQIDDSEIDLGRVQSKLSDFDNERNAARASLAAVEKERDEARQMRDTWFSRASVHKQAQEYAEKERDAAKSALAAAQERVKALEADGARLDWLEAHPFTAYRGRDYEDGRLDEHFTLVDEDKHPNGEGRTGIVRNTFRECLDAASAQSSEEGRP